MSLLETTKREFGGKLLASLALWRYTLYSSLLKIKLRNANSKLGVIWEPISTLIVSIVLSLVWVQVLGVENNESYFVYVYIGMVVWGLIASSISNLCATLLKNVNKLVTRPIHMYSYIFEDMLLSFIPFLMSIPILAIVIFFYTDSFQLHSIIIATFGVLNLLLAAFGFAISIGVIAFLFGDIRQLITSVMRLGFLITPVIWSTERLGQYESLLILNPFYGYLHFVRQPLIGGELKIEFIMQSVTITLFMILIGIFIVSAFSMKIQEKALKL